MENKPPLAYEELRDIIDLSLWAGQMLLQYGADSRRVEETVHRLGTGLGCDWMDILVSPNILAVTASSGNEFRTKIRRVVALGVNMSIIDAVNTLSRQVSAQSLDRAEVRRQLQTIDQLPHVYNRWMIAGAVGLACAAFSRLFGGDVVVFLVTLVASTCAMIVRQELNRRYFNAFLVVVVTAFVAGLLAGLATLFEWSDHSSLALAASGLLLVPGVHLINAAEDLIRGHLVTGIVRGLLGGIIALALALGLLLAMRVLGIEGL